jgi:hypothetical protein
MPTKNNCFLPNTIAILQLLQALQKSKNMVFNNACELCKQAKKYFVARILQFSFLIKLDVYLNCIVFVLRSSIFREIELDIFRTNHCYHKKYFFEIYIL